MNTHMSSSTEDLRLLFRAEVDTIRFLRTIDLDKDQTLSVNKYLQSVDFDEKTDTDEYVKNPINAFHLLQRTSQWIPKLQTTIPNLNFNFRSSSFYFFENYRVLHLFSPSF